MYNVITAPAELAVSLDLVKAQLNLKGFDDDDAYLTLLIQASTKWVENYLKLFLEERTLEVRVFSHGYSASQEGVFGTRGVYFPSPATEIMSVKSSVDAVESNLANDDFFLDTFASPSLLTPKKDTEWPEADYFIFQVKVGGKWEYMREPVQLSIMILVADAYENRLEQVRERKNNVGRLLEPYRCTEFIDVGNLKKPFHV